MPNLPATSPLATTSLENAKPQVKPGFLQFQDNDPCLATDCKYSNKFHFHCLFGNCKYVCKTSGKAESHCLDHINPNNNLVNVRDQFSYYSLQCLCPNQHCEFRMRGHYHCLRPGCYFVTNITTKLPWHVKKHEKAERRAANGFKYFTKREECGRLGCKYNQVNSHFHCIREGCQFSFLLKHQMTSHARKHMRRMLGKNFDRVPSQMMSHAHRSDDMHHMAGMSGGSLGGLHPGYSNMMDETDDYMDYVGGGSPLGLSSESSNPDRSCTSTPVENESSPAGSGCQVTVPASAAPADTAATHNAPPPPPPQPQPPSFSPALLRPPLPSLPYLLSPSCLSYSLLSASLGATRGVVMPTSTQAFSPIVAAPSPVKNDVPIVQDAAGNTISIPTATGAKKRFWIIEDMSPFGKRRKTASSRKMLDEGMMLEGFRRYDLYEDCRDAGCQFSLKVTHYHCTRENCGYRFCGRTHMYKHAQHHDRVDNLVLDDFKRFKSSLSCSFADCQFSGNSTHFHCLRCGFRCTDSTKVTAHRKHHGKQDVISAAGFCQFSSSVDCEVADCKYKLKCSHFHCTYPECKHTVVGMSQMDSHKRKHEKQERGELPSVSPNREAHLMGGRPRPPPLPPPPPPPPPPRVFPPPRPAAAAAAQGFSSVNSSPMFLPSARGGCPGRAPLLFHQPGRVAHPGHRRQQLAVLPEEPDGPGAQRLAGPEQEDAAGRPGRGRAGSRPRPAAGRPGRPGRHHRHVRRRRGRPLPRGGDQRRGRGRGGGGGGGGGGRRGRGGHEHGLVRRLHARAGGPAWRQGQRRELRCFHKPRRRFPTGTPRGRPLSHDPCTETEEKRPHPRTMNKHELKWPHLTREKDIADDDKTKQTKKNNLKHDGPK
ncbi:hypothetical protein ANANG_G00227050 [Anguilla anguilla]|uniref:C2H2-type domain-containing protein n=1 Tax=Anguilla anguilla TaxID=7936 RepID=A0A9D3M0Y1_ANGAN|nr:hypothetical protein ANANG_G00227050 [Anguilla anguilla]